MRARFDVTGSTPEKLGEEAHRIARDFLGDDPAPIVTLGTARPLMSRVDGSVAVWSVDVEAVTL